MNIETTVRSVKIIDAEKVVLGQRYHVIIVTDDLAFTVVGGNKLVLKPLSTLAKYEQERHFDLLEAREVKKMIQQLPEIYEGLVL